MWQVKSANRAGNQLQVEVDAAFLYRKLSEVSKDANLAEVLRKLSQIEEAHAIHALDRIREASPGFPMPPPSRRARIQMALGRIFGYDFVMANLADLEKGLAQTMVIEKAGKGERPSGYEANHMRIITAVANSARGGGFIAKVEGRHKTVGGNALRAAVLGANDGLVSNMSLVMGVAGAAAGNNIILLTGLAGMLAGAISMALGEWLSVQSSRELHTRQIELEAEELESSPEQEKLELALLYQARGMESSAAGAMAEKAFSNKEEALDTLVREELGIDRRELGGSAWEAAFASFFLFVIGAIIPVIPFLIWEGQSAINGSIAFSVAGLFVIGAAITLFTGRAVILSGLRQVLFGMAAAAVTYGIGKLIGISISGV